MSPAPRARVDRGRSSRATRAGSFGMLGLLILGACDGGTEPDLGRVPIEPPAVYRSWWSEVEACSGISGDFERVTWFVVHEFRDGDHILGQWNERREISIRSDVWLDREVVRHEVLHDLLRGDGDHARPEWAACAIDSVPEGVGGAG